jgi:Transposase DDE domain group 1
VVSQAGSVLLVETVRKVGVDRALSAALASWRKPRAVHDPGKILLDVAPAVAMGGDCLADVGMLRAEPAVFGPVASDPTSHASLTLSRPAATRPSRRYVPHGPKPVTGPGNWAVEDLMPVGR